MSRHLIPRRVRKKLWKLLGYTTPRSLRLDREAGWRMGGPLRRFAGLVADVALALTQVFAAIARAFIGFSSSLLSLRKDDAHAFS